MSLKEAECPEHAEDYLRHKPCVTSGQFLAEQQLIFVIGRDGKFLSFKGHDKALLIAPPEQFLNKHISSFLPDEVASMTMDTIENVYKTGKPLSFEYFLPMNGSVKYFEMTILDIGPDRVYCIVKDITEKKKSEEELSRANRALKALSRCVEAVARAALESALLTDICRIIVEDGGYSMAWIGYVRHDKDKNVKPMASAGHDDGYLDMVNVTWSDSMRGKGPTGTAIRTRKPCIVRYVSDDPIFLPWKEEAQKRGFASVISLPLFIHDKAVGALTIYSDKPDAFDEKERELLKELSDNLSYGISSMRERVIRNRVEKALRESEQKYRSVIEQSIDGVILIDENGQVVDYNESMLCILGISRDMLNGAFIWDILYPLTTEQYKRQISYDFLKNTLIEACKIGDTAWFKPFAEYEFVRSDGVPITLQTNVFSINMESAHMICGISRDVSVSKKARVALKESKEQAELYVDLMGHDINNINQIALGYLELAIDNDSIDAETRTMIEKPIEVLNNSTRLIENVRKLQKISFEKIPGERVDIGKVLGEVVGMYVDVPGRNIDLSYEPVKGCMVNANAFLRDVFDNLVNNAVKHSGVDAEINIVLQKNVVEDIGVLYHRVSVEDNGPGVPDALKDKIFSRQLRGTTKARGSGIGLYLVKTLVGQYGGKIWVEDRVPGQRTKGSRFVVLLPAA